MKNKLLWIPAAALMVLTVGLVPLNLLAVSFPSWVMWIPVVLLAAASVLFVLKSGARLWAKILLPVLSAVVIVLGLFAAYCFPYWNSTMFYSKWDHTMNYDGVLTCEQTEKDMEQMRAIVGRLHPRFIDGEPAAFTAAYEDSLERLKNDKSITVTDLYREIQRTLSVLGDGHTNAYPNYSGDRYLKSIAGRQAEGWKFQAINGKEPAELFEERCDLFCYEADSWGILTLKGKLNTLSGLAFLGIDPEGVQYTWVNEEGETATDTHTAADFLPMDEYVEHNAQYENDSDAQPEGFVWYEIDTENDLALLMLTHCKYNEEYKSCLREFFTEVKKQGISNVAVDIRGNGGGSSMVANEFIRYLNVDSYRVDGTALRWGPFLIDSSDGSEIKNEKYTDLTFEGDVYLLTDSGSFSSAMMFAEYIKDNDLGTIIGEPPGNDPNGYGDTAEFQLSNSGLYMSASTKQFFRPDRDCTDRLVMPDVECGGDAALEILYDLLSE